jgi:hypothetical protein
MKPVCGELLILGKSVIRHTQDPSRKPGEHLFAREKEAERDKKSAEADHLMHQHHRFANSVALFQVAIALGAVAALTRVRPVWYASIVVGLSGAVLFLATRV